MLPTSHIRSSKLDHVRYDNSIEDSYSNDNKVEPGEVNPLEIGMPRGLISQGRLVPTQFVQLVLLQCIKEKLREMRGKEKFSL